MSEAIDTEARRLMLVQMAHSLQEACTLLRDAIGRPDQGLKTVRAVVDLALETETAKPRYIQITQTNGRLDDYRINVFDGDSACGRNGIFDITVTESERTLDIDASGISILSVSGEGVTTAPEGIESTDFEKIRVFLEEAKEYVIGQKAASAAAEQSRILGMVRSALASL